MLAVGEAVHVWGPRHRRNLWTFALIYCSKKTVSIKKKRGGERMLSQTLLCSYREQNTVLTLLP